MILRYKCGCEEHVTIHKDGLELMRIDRMCEIHIVAPKPRLGHLLEDTRPHGGTGRHKGLKIPR